MNKKVVLFDLDNTLFEDQNAYDLAMKEVHNILCKVMDISFEEFKHLYKLSKSEIARELAGSAASNNKVIQFQRLIEKTNNTIDAEIVLSLYDIFWNTHLENTHLREWVIDVLKYLKDHWVKTAIVSNLTTHIQLRKINKLWLTPYIDHLITSEEAWVEKPNPVIFLLALNKLKCLSKDAIMVWDDLVNDIEWANAAWIDSILISNETDLNIDKEDYKKPKYIIKEFREIVWILEK